MPLLTTLKSLPFDEAARAVDSGAAFVDLRPIKTYLEAHIPGSLALLYEDGPGMPSRARDCLPLELPLILVDAPDVDLANAAAGLRGKGFAVLGIVKDALANWRNARGGLVSTVVLASEPADEAVLDVGDPGAVAPADALRIPVESLWADLDRLRGIDRVVIAAGYGVRAALAVGMLERADVKRVQLWRSRPVGG
jgi:rhodanese-related sulfurtransferase